MPFPEWDRFCWIEVPIDVSLPSGNGIAGFSGLEAKMSRTDTVESCDGAAQTPLVSPVRDVTVAGLPAFENAAGIGTTPVIRWSPPELGEAGQYVVEAHPRRQDLPGAQLLAPSAYIFTSSTEVQFPPGALKEDRD